MAEKLILGIFAVSIMLLSAGFLYQSVPIESIVMKLNSDDPKAVSIVNYGTTPVFAKNLRFNHNDISYFIDPMCSELRRSFMEEAFDIFEEEMKIISFHESNQDADISIGCSEDYIDLGERLFAAGEGGPSRIINTSQFKTIQKGKISLYRDPQCSYPIVEVHEIGHVFGFGHINNKDSIMYNVSNCNQRITPDMIDIIRNLYSIEALPDAVIDELTASKKGRYLDFNITILNEGLIGIDNISLTILAEGKIVQTISLDSIGIGYGRTLRATNVKLPSASVDKIEFVVDYNNRVREFDETNNLAEMITSTPIKVK
ncbi:MAG: matrixin family metalloprotease [Nanoarchaeota archaeon]|nr:matrixin family metalloprotease [Nanoarchaeota archaeon]